MHMSLAVVILILNIWFVHLLQQLQQRIYQPASGDLLRNLSENMQMKYDTIHPYKPQIKIRLDLFLFAQTHNQ